LPTDLAILTLLHVLVFVYWLGGDLGAFYASHFLTADNVTADKRMLAARIVGDVDMAPRTALLLALPTGLALASATGIISISSSILYPTIVVFVLWTGLAWWRHLNHAKPQEFARLIDLGLRWLSIAGLIGVSIASLAGQLDWPLFLALKCLLLALAIAIGLTIRVVLKPLGTALMQVAGDQSEAGVQALKTILGRARPLVMAIWACLITAAFLGLAKPY
jgi:hypothetical protein